MGSKKKKGKHNRSNPGNPDGQGVDSAAESATADMPDAAGAFTGSTGSNETAAATSILQPVPQAVIASPDDDRLAGFDIDMAGYPLNGELAQEGAYVARDFSEIPKKRKRRALKVFGITAGVVIACALVAYIAGAVVFMSRFIPNTFIDNYDISLKTDEEVETLLEDAVASYQLDVVGNGFTYQVTSEDIGLSIDSAGIVRSMHNDLDAWSWPLLLIEPSHDESRHFVISYKRDDCETALVKKVKKFNKDAKAPVDATIIYNQSTGKFDVKPEEAGKQLSAKAVKSSFNEAIVNQQPTLTLTEDHLKKPKVYSTDEKLVESAKLATGMVSAHVDLKLNGQEVNAVDGQELSQFVTIDENLDVTFQNNDMKQWVNEFTANFDTIGTERRYTRADDKEVVVKGGSYGWEIDTDATVKAILDAIKKGEKTTVDIPCISTAAVYNGPGQRDWATRYVDVDLEEQHVRFYGDKGKVIWEADCISGAPDGKRNTWEGVWYVNNKESPSTLIGYTEEGKKEYETKVTYWMPFEGNGIGFHDAGWQPDFGGTMYKDGYGSHGCINLDPADAKKLYGMIQVGDVVVVHS